MAFVFIFNHLVLTGPLRSVCSKSGLGFVLAHPTEHRHHTACVAIQTPGVFAGDAPRADVAICMSIKERRLPAIGFGNHVKSEGMRRAAGTLGRVVTSTWAPRFAPCGPYCQDRE